MASAAQMCDSILTEAKSIIEHTQALCSAEMDITLKQGASLFYIGFQAPEFHNQIRLSLKKQIYFG